MAAKRTWSDLDESTRKLIITVAVVEGILKVAGSHRHQASASKPDPGPEVAVGPLGGSGSTPPG